MPSVSKRKGNTFEREVVNKAKNRGIEAKRAYASNGMSLGLEEDVDALISGFKVQCKRRKRIASWLKPPESCDMVLVRENRGETFVVMNYEDWLNLIVGNEKHE